MAFDTGRVSYCRFLVKASKRKLPTAVDEKLLELLNEHSFTESSAGAPQVESGWITGRHILDTQFTYEKNGFGNQLLLALRIDTNKPPAELRQAYKLIQLDAAASANPAGAASRAARQEAVQLAQRQLHEELASGRFRRSKSVPVLWDLLQSVVYFGATGSAAHEQLHEQFRQTFDATLTPLGSGALASSLLAGEHRARDFEDLRPTAFTNAPQTEEGSSAAPSVPWVNASEGAATKDFLGNEFLLWLWWSVAKGEGVVRTRTDTGETDVTVMIDQSIDAECAWGMTGKLSLRADGPGSQPESRLALRRGKLPRRLGLIVADGSSQWELGLTGETLSVASASLPPADDAPSPRELVEQRLLSIRSMAQTLDGLFAAFVRERSGSGWESRRDSIKRWIAESAEPRRSAADAPRARAAAAV